MILIKNLKPTPIKNSTREGEKMAHIECDSFDVVNSSADIFTAHLTLDPAIKDTIIKTIKDSGDKQNRKTNVKADMTNWNMQEESGFRELEQEIASVIKYIPSITRPNDHSDHPMEIKTMWGLCYKKNDYTDVHDHWPSIWSGTFYLDIPTDYAGTLFFPELEYDIEPVTGQLVIFRGATLHGVKTIQSNSDRIAISFNYSSRVMLPDPLMTLIKHNENGV